ncbi:bifunctional enoyl-CoA hydratase/phosphate acetyltransferase [Vagococcus carniphilus]|uniref:bifunctional enoyl-CoA hydratase/phosphate acetyltransferase n=1 Tax=Vagococcus carniphilus TaxID=218144 RepID=UPI00288E1F2F|nr:bifunctional enoyl-CoA hydratase/phosphate acetyltransferase [Vagococcus carniphilus]MDT2815243.1 bifunctional enoyl-CoA hydratase/phosphate acetyltransferase [Vagococcus carniphilus]MDT2866018.1 bifunctional enoyl-CoA hydratase/phosphate acetyltransferase [Vagococcus carniphilus]
MVLTNFQQIEDKLKLQSRQIRVAVAAAGDKHTLESIFTARKRGIIIPILVGDKAKILEITDEIGMTVESEQIIDVSDNVEACQKAVSLVREKKADFIMKGLVDTSVLLKEVVNKETGLGTGNVMSHVAFHEVPTYHKLLCIVDCAMFPYPTLQNKKDIINNTVNTYLSLGQENPKVGVLACVEKVNPKMPETVEANELSKMCDRGEIPNCIVRGPISYDCAVSKEIAEHKGYESDIAGDVDVLVVPNIHAGNIMTKMLTCTSGAKAAGIIVGAMCPIVLASRGSSSEEKYMSLVLAAASA